MARTNKGATAAFILLLVVIIASACNQPYSQAPSVTSTPINPTSFFATGETPDMNDVANFGTSTALALSGTPQAIATQTISVSTTEPPCSTISSFVWCPSGVLRVSRLTLKARPSTKTSELINSNGITCRRSSIENLSTNHKTKARAPARAFVRSSNPYGILNCCPLVKSGLSPERLFAVTMASGLTSPKRQAML